MNEKVLVLASVASMIDQFNMPNIELLQSLSYEVHVACNFEKGSTCTQEKIIELKNKLKEMNVKIHQIDFTRSVFDIKQDIVAYRQVKKILIENTYKFIHCHSPIGGVVGRLACKATKTKCIYTAHGFHFFKGAPLKNWVLFYPIEKWLSRYTDVLITINKEDYQRAKENFHMKCIEYVPGVGIDIQKFNLKDFDREAYRKTLGLSNEDRMLLSVGELNENKNHQIVIKALGESKRNDIHYFIAGEGNQKDILMELAKQNNVEHNVHLLGHRNDINKLLHCADVFIHPSIREGLPVALMEAMACGVSCIVSNIRGNTDLIEDGKGGLLFEAQDSKKLAQYISSLLNDTNKITSFSAYNKNKVTTFSEDHVNKIMNKIYEKDIR